MSNSQAIRYLSEDSVTANSAATVKPMYESVDALRKELDTQAVLMDFGSPGNAHRDLRALLDAGVEGNDGQTALEDLYLITPVSTTNGEPTKISVEPLGTITWTAGPNDVLGGRDNEKIPKALTVVDNGRLATRTGFSIDVASAEPAKATIYDIGPSQFLLRVPYTDTAAGISPMGATWR